MTHVNMTYKNMAATKAPEPLSMGQPEGPVLLTQEGPVIRNSMTRSAFSKGCRMECYKGKDKKKISKNRGRVIERWGGDEVLGLVQEWLSLQGRLLSTKPGEEVV